MSVTSTSAAFDGSTHETTASPALWQYDYGQTLAVTGLGLNDGTVPVHFDTEYTSSATVMSGTVSGGVLYVAIPNALLRTASPWNFAINAYVYVVKTGTGTTIFKVKIPVKLRDQQASPDTSTQPSAWDQAIAGITTTLDGFVSGLADGTYPVAMDSALTDATKPAQGKAVGDAIAASAQAADIRIESAIVHAVNRSLYNNTPYKYVALTWENGGLSDQTGEETVKASRARTGFLTPDDLDGLMIDKNASFGYAVYVYFYDAQKAYLRRATTLSSSVLSASEIIATPKDVYFYRLLLIPSSGGTELASLDIDAATRDARGIVIDDNYETFDESTMRHYVPVLFGRGNVNGASGHTVDEGYSYSWKRIRTPYIPTSKVNVFVIDRTTYDYTVQVYYFDSKGPGVTYEYSNSGVVATGVPVIKEYEYFRLKVYLTDDYITENEITSSDFTPRQVMSDIIFYRDDAQPSVETRRKNQVIAGNTYTEIYPELYFRRRNMDTGQIRGYDDLMNFGCCRCSMEEPIPVSAVDFVTNDKGVAGWTLYITKLDENKEFIGYKATKHERAESSMWKGAAYVTFGIVPPNSSDRTVVITKQFFYENIHICKRGGRNGTGILDMNDRADVMPRLGQIAEMKSTFVHMNDHPQPLVLLHFSDLHNRTAPLSRIIEFRDAYSGYIHDVIHTGDSVGNANAENKWYTVPGAETILNVIGNHDTCTDTSSSNWNDWHALTEEEAYDRFLAWEYDSGNPGVTAIDTWGENGSLTWYQDHCYYFKDYTNYNVLLLVLDCMHETTGQLNWFSDMLARVLDSEDTLYGRHVIVAHHVRMKTGDNMDYIETSGFDNPHARRDPSSSLPYPIQAGQGYVDAVGDFISAGGTFVCWFCGHHHADILGTVTLANKPVLNIAVTTAGDIGTITNASGVKTARTPDSRIEGTKSYDAFNIMGIDTTRGLLKVMRVGMDYNSAMKHVDTMCWDYVNGQMVYTS